MAPRSWVPRDIDTERPSSARVYDYYLGGGNNFACDRALAKKVLSVAPEIRLAALANRQFLQRAVRFCAERGMRQFIDIGSGLPTAGSTHEVAQLIDRECRVLYVDNEPVTASHGELLLSGVPNTAVLRGDLRDVDGILNAETTRRLIDFAEPVGVCLFAVLHFVPDSDEPARLLARYRSAMAPGSHLALSHATADSLPSKMNAVADLYRTSQEPGTLRGREELRALLRGFELVEPGIVFLPSWRPGEPSTMNAELERSVCYAAVARVM